MFVIKVLAKELKKPITLVMILVVGLLIFFIATQIESSRENRSFVGHDNNNYVSIQSSSAESYKKMVSKNEYKDNVMQAYELFDTTRYEIVKAALSENTNETLNRTIFFNLIFLKWTRMSPLEIDEINLKKDIYEMWNKVARGIEYDSVDFRPDTYPSSGIEQLLLETRYLMRLYDHNITPVYEDEANNVTLAYRFLYDIGPVLFVLIPLLIAYNSIPSDLNSGSLKLLLSQSLSRKRYYFSKWLCSVIQSFIVLIAPVTAVCIFYSIRNGFVSMIYPVTYLSNVWTRIKPIPNYIEVLFRDGTQPFMARYSFIHMAPSNGIVDDYIQPHTGIDLIPIYQYLLIGLLLASVICGLSNRYYTTNLR